MNHVRQVLSYNTAVEVGAEALTSTRSSSCSRYAPCPWTNMTTPRGFVACNENTDKLH